MSFTQASTHRQTETSRRAGNEQLPTVTARRATSITTGPAPAGSSAGGGPPGPPPGPPGPGPPDRDQDPPDGNLGNPGGAPPDPDDDDDDDEQDIRDNLADAISALANSVARPHTQHSKVREPDQFDSRKLRSFLVQCQLNFNDQVTAFASDKSKVNYVLSFLNRPFSDLTPSTMEDPRLTRSH